MSEILKLEKRRKNLVLKFAAYITVSAILIYWFLRFCVYFYTISKEELDFTSDNNIMFYVVCIVAYIIVHGYFKFSVDTISYDLRDFRSAYKDAVLKPFIKQLGFKYEKYGHVHALNLIHSELFSSGFDVQEGNDFIRGTASNVRFSLSDIVLSDMKYNFLKDLFFGYNFSLRKKRLLYGLFFEANFNRAINSNTRIFSKKLINFQNFKLKKIKMDNTDFNKIFDVFTDDKINANYILTPKFMENLTKIAKFARHDFRMSFKNDRVFMFFNQNRDSFEPNMLKSVNNRKNINEIKREILAVIGIIKTLELNKKIWIYGGEDELNRL